MKSLFRCMENKTNAKGDYIYGAYERIIPIFESLGLKGVISSEEFTARYTQAKENDKENGASDTTFSALLTPIVNLVEDLMKHPLNTILDLLPRAARIHMDRPRRHLQREKPYRLYLQRT